LGGEFLDVVEACIDSIRDRPELYPLVHGSLRRVVLRRFPYNVVYNVSLQEIVVLGCVYGRRDPHLWRDRT